VVLLHILRASDRCPSISLVTLLPHAVVVVMVAAALRRYRLASIRCVPQLPAGSVDFTTFTWTALLRRLKAMGVSGDSMRHQYCCLALLVVARVDFTTFTWTALLRRLKAMGVSGDGTASTVQQC
jgi:hypothetical protein